MSDLDMSCYRDRYLDINGMNERDHYSTIGKKEGRNPNCATHLTDTMAKRYLMLNTDLQRKFGMITPNFF